MNALREYLRGTVNLECTHYCRKLGMIGMIDRHELFASKKRKSPQIGIYDELN